MHLRFSIRQQEFARLYAADIPAPKAAIAAGYAASTAETNAARILSHPRVTDMIAAVRGSKVSNFTTEQDNQNVLARLRHIINHVQDERLALAAIEQFRRIKVLESKIDAQAFIASPYLDAYMPVDAESDIPQSISAQRIPHDNNDDNKVDSSITTTQLALNQQNDIMSNPPAIVEADTLPDGRAAFDMRLGIAPPVVPEAGSVTINLYPAGQPVHPHAIPDPNVFKLREPISSS